MIASLSVLPSPDPEYAREQSLATELFPKKADTLPAPPALLVQYLIDIPVSLLLDVKPVIVSVSELPLVS
jgi:hypothetical protein